MADESDSGGSFGGGEVEQAQSYGTVEHVSKRRESLWKTSTNILMWVRLLTSITSIAEGYADSVVAGVVVLASKEFALVPWERGLLTSMAGFGCAIGPCMGSGISDKFGRRPCLCMAYMALTFGALTMALSPNFGILACGRCFETVGMGLGLGVVIVYLSEVSPAKIRGQFSAMEEGFLVVGVNLGFIANRVLLNAPYNWRFMVGLGAVLPMLSVLLLLLGLIPESPRFKEMQGKIDGPALEALVGKEEARATIKTWKNQGNGTPALWSEVLWPPKGPAQRALKTCLGLAVAKQISLIHFATLYSTKIIAEHTSERQAFNIVMCIGTIRVLLAVIMVFLVDLVGRSKLMFLSSLATAVSLLLAGLSFYLNLDIAWKIAALAAIPLSHEIGLGPASWAFFGEVLDTRVRSKSLALTFLVRSTLTGVLTFVFVIVADGGVGLGPCFLAAAALNFLSALWIWWCVPETKGVALEDMSSIFADRASDGNLNIPVNT